jgi:3-hydroxyisobutyrate dehydrogenase
MQVGFLGLGNMGRAMVANLLKGGHEVIVWNRTAATAQPLREQGARLAATPPDACRAGVVFSMLADDDAIEQVLVAGKALAAMQPGTIHVNMATVSVAAARRLETLHAEHKVGYVAAPVMGRPDMAAAAKLTLLAAGPASHVQAVQPLFDLMGQKTVYLGEAPYRANAMKLTVNFMLTSAVETLAEAGALANAYGIETGTLVDLVSNSIFPGPVYAGYGAMMAKAAYEPAGFRARLGLKDVKLAQAAAHEAGAPLPLADVVAGRLQAAVEAGVGEHDLAVLGQVALANSRR